MNLVVALFFMGLAASPGQPAVESCQSAATTAGFSLSAYVGGMKNLGSNYRTAYEQADSKLAACPDEEALWYVLLRAGELLKSTERPVDFMKRAERAHARFPASARIGTVWSRLSGTLEAADQALQTDPSYLPAAVAGASILIARGEYGPGCRRLDAIPADKRELVPGACLALAWCRLKAGSPQEALWLAEQDRRANGFEPSLHYERLAEFHEVAGRAGFMLGHRLEGISHLSIGSEMGRRSARQFLEQLAKDPHTRLVLEAFVSDPARAEIDKTLIRGVLATSKNSQPGDPPRPDMRR